MAQLTVYEEKALANIAEQEVWLSVSDVGNCRLSTLNKLVETEFDAPDPIFPTRVFCLREEPQLILMEEPQLILREEPQLILLINRWRGLRAIRVLPLRA